MKPIVFFTSLILLLTSLSTFASSGGESSGGGAIVIDGKTYRLADLFFKPYRGSSFTYDDQLKNQLQLVNEIFASRGTDTTEFFSKHIFNPYIEYYFVSRLPKNCRDPMETEKNSIQYACTQGWVTWIVPKYFMQLSLIERASGIIHERLHALAPSQPHEVIVPFVKGTVLLQQLFEKRFVHPRLSNQEVEALEDLRFRAGQLGFNMIDGLRTHPWGGGVHRGNVSDSMFLDVSSRIIDSEIDSPVHLYNTVVEDSKLGAGLRIQDSVISLSEIAPDSPSAPVTVRNSWLGQVRIHENVTIQNTRLVGIGIAEGWGLLRDKNRSRIYATVYSAVERARENKKHLHLKLKIEARRGSRIENSNIISRPNLDDFDFGDNNDVSSSVGENTRINGLTMATSVGFIFGENNTVDQVELVSGKGIDGSRLWDICPIGQVVTGDNSIIKNSKSVSDPVVISYGNCESSKGHRLLIGSEVSILNSTLTGVSKILLKDKSTIEDSHFIIQALLEKNGDPYIPKPVFLRSKDSVIDLDPNGPQRVFLHTTTLDRCNIKAGISIDLFDHCQYKPRP